MLLTLLAATAIAIAATRSLFAAVMLTGLYSLVSAGVFLVMDAVDVAFTEASVGAGITLVLMLGTLSHTGESESRPRFRPWVPLLVVFTTGAALFYATLDMPRFGDPEAPIHQHVAPHYLQDSLEEVGPPNVVTSVLASYRGYDTLGEVVVIFTAGIGVMLLLGSGRGSRKSRP